MANKPSAMNSSSSNLNRRHFLKLVAGTGSIIWLGAPSMLWGKDVTKPDSNLLTADLAGTWEVSPAGKDEWMPASVPGCVHTDLLSAGKIPDPFYRDNEASLQWIGQSDWCYRRRFQVPADLFQRDRVLLRCEGLDTLAEIKVNGQKLGSTTNMFRVWEFDVKPVLKPGDNLIEITFTSPYPLMAKRNAARPMYEWIGSHEPKGRAYVRKEPCSFGWDWGPVLASCGIGRGIGIHAFDEGRLNNFLVLQDHTQKKQVRLNVKVDAELVRPGKYGARVTVWQNGRKVGGSTVVCLEGKASASFQIKNPKLWWPAGMGQQPLYEVTVELLNPSGVVIGQMVKRIGLRTLKVKLPEGELPLRFEVNGIPFFAKGANLIPTDIFPNRVTTEKLRRYVADAVAANMNSLRFWGGGYYEEDELFDACDEMGICVWMDFKFACSAYPAFDPEFLENVRHEARDNLLRLRHHACIAVWCGNNEISLMTKEKWSNNSMGRTDYDRLFKDLIGNEVEEFAPQANYVSGSPDCGDVHFWDVWHKNQPFEVYRTVDGFMSEFGFQSFPHPKTIRSFTTEADRDSVLSPVMKWHQRAHEDGNEKIVTTINRYFKPPKDFESTIWLSQILQGYGIKMGAEHWRQTMPKSMGCIYWQYNDCWPVASWSSVDYFGRWKALHYLARRFYAPILVSGVEDVAKGTIEVFVTSDQLEATPGKLRWEVTDIEGRMLLNDACQIDLPARASQMVRKLDLNELINAHQAKNLLTWLRMEVDGKIVSENLVFFGLPKELSLVDPKLTFSVREIGKAFQVTLQSERPALWVWLELDGLEARYSDNFVHLQPNHAMKLMVYPHQPVNADQLTKWLRVHSLYDLS